MPYMPPRHTLQHVYDYIQQLKIIIYTSTVHCLSADLRYKSLKERFELPLQGSFLSKMSSKVVSQQLITDQFSHQKSKGKGKQTVRSPARTPARTPTGSPIKSGKRVEVESAEDLIRKKHLDTLREFDLDWRFGPCTGITRLERWERAESHGQNPSPLIKDLILEHEDDEEFVQNIWSGYPL